MPLPRIPPRSQAKKTQAIGRSKHSSVSFTLQDSDVGDMFDVAIFKDPVYGTPVFRTKSGRSKCPHETHTVSREKIGILFDGGFKKWDITLTPGIDEQTVMFELSDRSVTGDSGKTTLALKNPTSRTQPPLTFKLNTAAGINLGPVGIAPIKAGTFVSEQSSFLCFIGAHFHARYAPLPCSFPMLRRSPGDPTRML